MSNALSEQSCVCEEASYDEVFLSSQDDPGTLSNERDPSATLPSTGDENLDMDGSKSDSNNGLAGAKSPIQSVIGPNGFNGFREFIMLLLWTAIDFISSIK